MNHPLVSFVLPAYKKDFLYAAINSILSQTYKDFELVIVNDASPYNLQEIVCQFDDLRITYHENEMNLGGTNLTDSWNHAMQYAKGEYIVLASDDDVYHPEYLEKLLMLVGKYPSVDLFHCRLRYVNENDEFQMLSQPALEYESCEDFVYQRLFNNRKQAAPEFLFRKSAMDRLGGFISFPIAWYSDDATWAALSVNGVCCTKEALLNFRMSGQNLSTNGAKSQQKIEALYQYKGWMISFLESRNPKDEDDKGLLNICKKSVEEILNYHLFMYIPYLSFKELLKVLRTAVGNNYIKKKTAISYVIRRIL